MSMHAAPTPVPLRPPCGRTWRNTHPPATKHTRSSDRSSEEAHLQEQYAPDLLRVHTLGHFRVHLPGGESAEPQWLTPQSMQVLKCLLAAPGQQLAHDELIEWLWPEDSADHARRRLQDALSKLRRALEPHRPAYGRSTYVLTNR